MKRQLFAVFSSVFLLLLIMVPAQLPAEDKPVAEDERCPVCGMFVAKYQEWLARIEMSNGALLTFDGVKDMMAYYFNPQQFGAEPAAKPAKVIVKDYYTLDWLDGRNAFYVLGGDVLGPMGHELIPFSSMEAAENFMTDHHGEKILTFSEIDGPLIEKLRQGHKMMKSMNKK